MIVPMEIVKNDQCNDFNDLICRLCFKTLGKPSSLRAHLKKIHLLETSSIKDLVPRSKKKGVFKFHCAECPKSFNHVHHFKHHIRSHVSNTVGLQTAKIFSCPSCNFSGKYDDIINHFKEGHSLSLEIENLQFDKFATFLDWKKLTEKRTCCRYILKQSKNKNSAHYICHRSGYFKTKGKNRRLMKRQGSKKIDGFCPAAIDVKIDKVCTVKFVSSHYGHFNELCHFNVSPSEREKIAKQSHLKIPAPVILDTTRESINNIDSVDFFTTNTAGSSADTRICIDSTYKILTTDKENDVSKDDLMKLMEEIVNLARTKRQRKMIMTEILKMKLCITAENTIPSDPIIKAPRGYARKVVPQI